MSASYPKPDNNCTRGIQAWYSEGGQRDTQLAPFLTDNMARTRVLIARVRLGCMDQSCHDKAGRHLQQGIPIHLLC